MPRPLLSAVLCSLRDVLENLGPRESPRFDDATAAIRDCFMSLGPAECIQWSMFEGPLLRAIVMRCMGELRELRELSPGREAGAGPLPPLAYVDVMLLPLVVYLVALATEDHSSYDVEAKEAELPAAFADLERASNMLPKQAAAAKKGRNGLTGQ